MDIETLKADLIRHEDRIPHAYLDSRGFWTIGVGHLIDRRRGGGLPPHIIDALLVHDIEQKTARLDARLPWWRTLSDGRQRALVRMAFNLGVGGLLGFRRMLAALEAGHYEVAAVEALDSNWAVQVGSRAERIAELIKNG